MKILNTGLVLLSVGILGSACTKRTTQSYTTSNSAALPEKISSVDNIATATAAFLSLQKNGLLATEVHIGEIAPVNPPLRKSQVIWAVCDKIYAVFNTKGDFLFNIPKAETKYLPGGEVELKTEGQLFRYQGLQSLRPTLRQLAMEGAAHAAEISLALGKNNVPSEVAEQYRQMIRFFDTSMLSYLDLIKSDDLDKLVHTIVDANRKLGIALLNAVDFTREINPSYARQFSAIREWTRNGIAQVSLGNKGGNPQESEQVGEPLLKFNGMDSSPH